MTLIQEILWKNHGGGPARCRFQNFGCRATSFACAVVRTHTFLGSVLRQPRLLFNTPSLKTAQNEKPFKVLNWRFGNVHLKYYFKKCEERSVFSRACVFALAEYFWPFSLGNVGTEVGRGTAERPARGPRGGTRDGGNRPTKHFAFKNTTRHLLFHKYSFSKYCSLSA